MKLSSLKIDAARAEQGAWIGAIPDMGELRLKVRGFGNSDYQRALARESAAVPRDKRTGGRIDPTELEALMARCMVEAIIMDWDGITDDDGEPVPFSKAKASEILTDPNFRPFREAVAWAARAVEEIEADKVESAVGNSANASGGTSTGGRKPSTSRA